MISYGRVRLFAVPGKDSPVCDNCQTRNVTMYLLELAKATGKEPNIKIVLCVTCKCHLVGMFRKADSYNDY